MENKAEKELERQAQSLCAGQEEAAWEPAGEGVESAADAAAGAESRAENGAETPDPDDGCDGPAKECGGPRSGADGGNAGQGDGDANPEDAGQETQNRKPENQEPEKKGFFGKKKDKKDARDAQLEELTDRLKRNMAEFDNFRKRTEKEKSAMYEIGARDIIEKILPVVDNFERGLATVPEEDKGSPFAEGMEKIYKQLMKTLEDLGVKPIEAVGKEFDPNLHNAVMHVDDENLGENTVAAELQKGYTYRDAVVRHSMVQVAN